MWIWLLVLVSGVNGWSRLLSFPFEQSVFSEELAEDTSDVPGPADLLQMVHVPDPEVSNTHQISRSFLRLTKDLLSLTPRLKGDQQDFFSRLDALSQLSVSEVTTLIQEQGIVIPPTRNLVCSPEILAYRTLDGSCNNIRNPCWGKAREPYQRWLPPHYGNGIDEPRRRSDGFHLPNPRLVYQWVSHEFHQTPSTEYPYLTSLLVTWGQFVSHDMLLTPTVTVKSWEGQKLVDKKLQCCDTSAPHPDCMPVFMHHQDSFHSRGHCMEFVRSAAFSFSSSSCSPPSLGHKREQINQLTAFIDASAVYGASDEELRLLREHGGRGAKLIMQESSGKYYAPRKNSTCKAFHQICDKRCHSFGEKRANENPTLAAMHTLMARHHNNLVDRLRSRRWDEETLFQVVRKIVGAQMQHITYNEYLPLILGQSLTIAMNLNVPTDNYRYNTDLNPTIYNVFATAAYRFGHSMVSSRQKRKGKKLFGSPPLSQDFFSVDEFCESGNDAVANLLVGQAEQHAQKVDCLFSKEITNHLFAKVPLGPGLDIFSINIQRGRDHGLPPYNYWREACGLPKAKDYVDLRNEIPDFIVDRLEIVYGPGRVNDVDLYVAAISERPVNDGILGPTFTCIVSNQFRNVKFGDRFWYENTDHPGALSPAQVNEIMKTTLSSLLCQDTDVKEMQMFAFVVENSHNLKSPCSVILERTKLNLNMWP